MIASIIVLKLSKRKVRYEISKQLAKIGVVMIALAIMMLIAEISYTIERR